MGKLYFGLIPVLLLAGCAPGIYVPPPSTSHYQVQLSDWVGKNVNVIPSSWGTPVLSTSTVTAEGMHGVDWKNTPRWGCTTTAIADSSDTIRSWTFDGPDCMTDYSDHEIKQIQAKNLVVQSVARKLKRGTPVHMTFYDQAVEIHSNRSDAPLDGYFLSYSSVFQEITVRLSPIPKSGFILDKDSLIYEIRFVSNLHTRQEAPIAPSPTP